MSATVEHGILHEKPLRRSWFRVTSEKRDYLEHLGEAGELPPSMQRYLHTIPWPIHMNDSNMHITQYFSADDSAGIVIQTPPNTWITAPLRSRIVSIDKRERGYSTVTLNTLEEPFLSFTYGNVNTETPFIWNSYAEVAAGQWWGTAGRLVIDHQRPRHEENILSLQIARQPLAGTTIYRSDLLDPILLLKRLY